ncbi:hypothetical protein A8924_0478 [Saccharopolyspora erythraea NRRL 2338]|nr:hypothetical protein A8924_0478 [Saccharopolyspora erythraea NRRL 2338]
MPESSQGSTSAFPLRRTRNSWSVVTLAGMELIAFAAVFVGLALLAALPLMALLLLADTPSRHPDHDR